MILLHGVGTNGRQMMTILGKPLADRGYETIAADMPIYGLTEVAPGALVTYDDWVRIASDLVEVERARDDRPIVLYGLSAGGMQAYHVAAVDGRVRGVVGMTFLDQRDRQVATETAVTRLAGRLGTPVVAAAGGSFLRRLRVPMRLVSKMHALVNDRAAARACHRDRTSAGNRVTLAFLRSYLRYVPAVEPADFDVCPVLLTQPAADRWTPLHLSRPFLDALVRVPVDTVLLENAGHYPLEQPGLDQLVAAVNAFCAGVTAPSGD